MLTENLWSAMPAYALTPPEAHKVFQGIGHRDSL